jgi:hypothetical protein
MNDISNTTPRPATSGDMQRFLLDQMVAVVEGRQSVPTASAICKISQQCYNWASLELRAANMQSKRGGFEIKTVDLTANEVT